MNTFKKIASVFAAAAMALSLAACSNINGSSSASDSTDDSSAASGSYRTVDQIKESGLRSLSAFSLIRTHLATLTTTANSRATMFILQTVSQRTSALS